MLPEFCGLQCEKRCGTCDLWYQTTALIYIIKAAPVFDFRILYAVILIFFLYKSIVYILPYSKHRNATQQIT